ncbi:MAG: cell division protein SepF [Pseudonocardia sp.]|nr:cell division protein SepF [Pseudonocardia sp.]
MGAMYRLKAYFGMVPAEDMAEYADGPPVERYAGRRREYDRWGDGEYVPEREYVTAGRDVRVAESRAPEVRSAEVRVADDRDVDRYDDWDRRPARESGRPVGAERAREPVSRLDREPMRGAGLGPSAVRGALAMDTDALREPPARDQSLREPARLPERTPAPAVPEPRLGGAAALARITTLQPRSYNEARTIGERYRDGVPVIMNLTDLDDAAAKRLVDFAAGLAFALRGSIDKVTSRVFLLTPADVEVSADDARRLAERGLFRQD